MGGESLLDLIPFPFDKETVKVGFRDRIKYIHGDVVSRGGNRRPLAANKLRQEYIMCKLVSFYYFV